MYGTTFVRKTNYKKTWSASFDEMENLLANTPDYAQFEYTKTGNLLKFMSQAELLESLEARQVRKTDNGQIFFVMPLFPSLSK